MTSVRSIAAVLFVAVGLVGIGGQVAAQGACGEGEQAWDRGGVVVCVHVDTRDELLAAQPPLIAASGGVAAATSGSPWAAARDAGDLRLVCDRSSDPHRTEVIYVYPTGGTNQLGARRAEIDDHLAVAQSQYDMSSAVHGGRNAWIPRFVTETAGEDGCRAAIRVERVAPALLEDPNVYALFAELESRGYDDANRSYLALVDTSSTTYCGLGSLYGDDRPSAAVNANNQRPAAAFARVDRHCWGEAIGHELAHNLGAVQNSAPNSTLNSHCTDGLDTMCYVDGGARSWQYSDRVCTGGDAVFVLDCNADDYFSPAPARGSYLDGHWNIADSDWLIRTLLGSWSRGGAVGASGTVFDDVSYSNVFASDITALAAAGVTKGCNPPSNVRFCPTRDVSREQMAAFLDRALGLPPGNTDFVDVAPDSIFRDQIQSLAAAGVTKGCNPPANDRFCPTRPVTREQMAAFLVRALDLPAGSPTFVDVPADSPFRSDIAALAAAGITKGCNPPANDRFCPKDTVTRQQMAAFLRRADLLD